MRTTDLFEVDPQGQLTGYLDIPGLASMLDVDNPTEFTNAIDKVRLGQSDEMTIPQMSELAHAFVHLLGMDGPQKSTLLRRLMAVHTANDVQPNAATSNSVAAV